MEEGRSKSRWVNLRGSGRGARPLANPASKDYKARVSLTKNNVFSLSLFVYTTNIKYASISIKIPDTTL